MLPPRPSRRCIPEGLHCTSSSCCHRDFQNIQHLHPNHIGRPAVGTPGQPQGPIGGQLRPVGGGAPHLPVHPPAQLLQKACSRQAGGVPGRAPGNLGTEAKPREDGGYPRARGQASGLPGPSCVLAAQGRQAVHSPPWGLSPWHPPRPHEPPAPHSPQDLGLQRVSHSGQWPSGRQHAPVLSALLRLPAAGRGPHGDPQAEVPGSLGGQAPPGVCRPLGY